MMKTLNAVLFPSRPVRGIAGLSRQSDGLRHLHERVSARIVALKVDTHR